MADKNGFCKYLAKIFKEQCKRINVKYESVDFQEDGWYHKYQWTKEQENSFKEWLMNFLYTNDKARRELMTCSDKNKEACQQAANWFILDYSWKIEDLTVGDVEKNISDIAKFGREPNIG